MTTIPLVADLVERFPAWRWVYYCVDDFSVWPGLDQKPLEAMERELVSRCHTIIAVSETLREVDTSHVGPTASVLGLENVMRDDVATAPMPRDVTLANAPLREDPFLRVPTVLEEGR